MPAAAAAPAPAPASAYLSVWVGWLDRLLELGWLPCAAVEESKKPGTCVGFRFFREGQHGNTSWRNGPPLCFDLDLWPHNGADCEPHSRGAPPAKESKQTEKGLFLPIDQICLILSPLVLLLFPAPSSSSLPRACVRSRRRRTARGRPSQGAPSVAAATSGFSCPPPPPLPPPVRSSTTIPFRPCTHLRPPFPAQESRGWILVSCNHVMDINI